jgi:Flp pilus assembly protein TadB
MAYVAIGGILASTAMSFIGANMAKKTADKQRKQVWNQETMKVASNEKLKLIEIATTAETDRIKIFSDGLGKYREVLQKESTIRLRDTWIYVASLGAGTGVIYAVSLMASKIKQ